MKKVQFNFMWDAARVAEAAWRTDHFILNQQAYICCFFSWCAVCVSQIAHKGSSPTHFWRGAVFCAKKVAYLLIKKFPRKG
jgi:hypothetical protein